MSYCVVMREEPICSNKQEKGHNICMLVGTSAEVVGKIKEKDGNLILVLSENDGICRCNYEFRAIRAKVLLRMKS